MRTKLSLPGLGLLLLLLEGCATAPPAALFMAPGSATRQALTVSIGVETEGLSPLIIRGGPLQSALIRGEARREGEGWRVSLTGLDWFNSWTNGWTEAAFLLDGTASLQPTDGGWTLTVQRAPQLDAVESASIRYYDTYVRGQRGQAEFSHRWDRVQAVAKDILARQSAEELAGDPRRLRRYLFPEIYGYDSPPESGHARVLVQGFAWDSDYTAHILPEPLRVLRDSGTLLRDYRESPGLWSLALEWKALWERAALGVALVRAK